MLYKSYRAYTRYWTYDPRLEREHRTVRCSRELATDDNRFLYRITGVIRAGIRDVIDLSVVLLDAAQRGEWHVLDLERQ